MTLQKEHTTCSLAQVICLWCMLQRPVMLLNDCDQNLFNGRILPTCLIWLPPSSAPALSAISPCTASSWEVRADSAALPACVGKDQCASRCRRLIKCRYNVPQS
jgi:hypothetical protein